MTTQMPVQNTEPLLTINRVAIPQHVPYRVQWLSVTYTGQTVTIASINLERTHMLVTFRELDSQGSPRTMKVPAHGLAKKHIDMLLNGFICGGRYIPGLIGRTYRVCLLPVPSLLAQEHEVYNIKDMPGFMALLFLMNGPKWEQLSEPHQRRLKMPSIIAALERMIDGTFQLHPDPILVTINGIVFNFQHRLFALLLFDGVIDACLSMGWPMSVIPHIDNGSNRLVTEAAACAGKYLYTEAMPPEKTTLAAARAIYREANGSAVNEAVIFNEVLDVFGPDFEAIETLFRMRGGSKFRHSQVLAGMALVHRLYPQETETALRLLIANTLPNGEKHPLQVLHKYLTSSSSGFKRDKKYKGENAIRKIGLGLEAYAKSRDTVDLTARDDFYRKLYRNNTNILRKNFGI